MAGARRLRRASTLALCAILSLPAFAGAASATTPAPSKVVPVTAKVLVIGDSLTVGTLDYATPNLVARLREVGWLATTSAVVGRRVTQDSAYRGKADHSGMYWLARYAKTAPLNVVIALGTNDVHASKATAASWIATARRLVGPTRTIYWVNLSMGRKFTTQTVVNAGLLAGVRADNAKQIALKATGRAYVLDWYAYTHAVGLSTGADGIHYCSTHGYPVRARFIAYVASGQKLWTAYRVS